LIKKVLKTRHRFAFWIKVYAYGLGFEFTVNLKVRVSGHLTTMLCYSKHVILAH